jgi:hypothetical protein
MLPLVAHRDLDILPVVADLRHRAYEVLE